MFNLEHADIRACKNRQQVEKMAAGLIRYYSDPAKKERTLELECKFCFYINKARIGGDAITVCICENCGKSMTFESTNTDMLCVDCASHINHCKHCGQKLD